MRPVASVRSRRVSLAASLLTRPIQADYGGIVSAVVGWPNEPAGNTLIYDDPCTLTPPVGADNAFPPNYSDCINANGYITRIDDATAPQSPNSIWQWLYPVGLAGGTSPGAIFDNVWGPHKEIYVGMKWKVSSPWQCHTSGVNKIFFVGNTDSGGTACDIQMFSPSGTGAPYELDFVTEFVGGEGPTSIRRQPNVTNSNISLGVWHTIELYLKYSTNSSTADGIVKWWLDGVLQGNFSNMKNDGDTGWHHQGKDPTWGGGVDTKTQNDYYWFDHFHLSYT